MASASETVTMTRTERYRKFLQDEKLADVTFLVGAEKVPVRANKVILRFGSEVFDEMFGNPEPAEQDTFEVPDLEPEEFRKFLEYLYTGELEDGFKDAGLMLKGALRYGAVDLVKYCAGVLKDSLSVENCSSTLALALQTKNPELEEATIAFICKYENAAKIFNPEFEHFDFTDDALLKILPSDELVIDELMLFETIVGWGKKEVAKESPTQSDNPKYLRSKLENLLKFIRFPLIKPSDFSTKVDRQELLTTEETMAVLLYFNVDQTARNTYQARIFNSKPRKTILKEKRCKNTNNQCYAYNGIATLQPNGRYLCSRCRDATNQYP